MNISFEAFQFIQGMTYDVKEEIEDLEKAIEAEDKNEVRKQYNHCQSLLTGIAYALEYIEDESARRGLLETVEEMRKLVACHHAVCKKIVNRE